MVSASYLTGVVTFDSPVTCVAVDDDTFNDVTQGLPARWELQGSPSLTLVDDNLEANGSLGDTYTSSGGSLAVVPSPSAGTVTAIA